jgi:O-antigen ligase
VSHTVIALIFAGASACALALLVRGTREARSSGELDSSAALTFAVGALVLLPDVLVAVTGTRKTQPDVFGDLVTINPGWYHSVSQLSLAVLAGLAATLFVSRVGAGRAQAHAAGVFAILLCVVATAAANLHGASLIAARGGVLLVCLLAATVLPRGRGSSLGAGAFGVLLAAAGGFLSLFRYDVAFVVPCEGACGGLGFNGVLANENLLGIVLAAAIPLTYLGFKGRTRLVLVLYLAGMAIATGSRTAAAASILAVVALVLVRPRPDEARPSLARTAVAWIALIGSVAGSMYIVQHEWPQTALTTRPALWRVAWDYIGESPWFGYGPWRWETLSRSSEIPMAAQRSTHNQWTDVLFVAGGVGAVVLLVVAIAAIWSSGQARNGVLLALSTIALIGTSEGAWSVGKLDLMSFSLVAVILIGETAPGSRRVLAPREAATRHIMRPPRPRPSTL